MVAKDDVGHTGYHTAIHQGDDALFPGQLLQDLPVDVYRYDLMVGIPAQINGYVFSRWPTAQDYYSAHISVLFYQR
jgi:hypothetical protein